MTTQANLPLRAPDRDRSSVDEHRVIIYNVSWPQYVGIRELLEENPGVRLTYLKGVLEIMSPSPEHERIKKIMARLIEIYAVVKRLPLNGYGSATFRKEAQERGLEPDECYVFGALKEVPDIAIEVVLTSGGIDKLAVYAGLCVPEVWFLQDGRFSLHRLADDGYAPIARSSFLPDLDLELLARFLDREDQTAAIIEYQDAIG